ncbi:hypothetical protein CR203_23435 [Salipaludibacillus neizhouensis]|uniref:Integrase n=1 Tax=Salipaludibacillus neizhouensis TaxID=885475 RepID=A0A3A9JVK7_9BACI|nr:tyrosine-type recombinase/integrase [Salipaludibacillus neizhouensis]RKL64964.1 hypothetical protein CR203_23435 [Salipaludibacillus neizhouensis]
MPIKIQSEANYDAVCLDLGITIDELVEFSKNKHNYSVGPIKCLSTLQVIEEFTLNLKEMYSANRRSVETLKTYMNFIERLKKFIEKQYPTLLISEINENHLHELLSTSVPRKGNKLSTRTLNKYLAIIRKMLEFSFERGYVGKDLRYKFQIGKTKTLPRYLSDSQIEKVLDLALQKTYGYRKRAMLYFLLGTGCRVSEATNLKVQDFNTDTGLIFIRNGKGNKERYIPIYDEVKDTILRYLKMSGIPKWDYDCKGYLFSNDEGMNREKKILDRSVQYLVRGIFDELDIGKDFTVHSFRHTFAVGCLKSGMRLEYLMQILGHENPETTKIYTELMPHDLKDEAMKYYPFPFEKLANDIFIEENE